MRAGIIRRLKSDGPKRAKGRFGFTVGSIRPGDNRLSFSPLSLFEREG